MKVLNEYRITYSVLDDLTGEILEENSESTMRSGWDLLASAQLMIDINHKYRNTDTRLVIHQIETLWHEQ